MTSLRTTRTLALGRTVTRMDRITLAALALLATACAPQPPTAAEPEGLCPVHVVEASGEVDETGGLVSVRDGASYAYLSVPAEAVPSPRRVHVALTPTATGYAIRTEPEMALARPAELRLEPAAPGATVLVDGAEVPTRALPGALVVVLDALGGEVELLDAIER